jgi:peptide/nickel transport system ATP-binding protein
MRTSLLRVEGLSTWFTTSDGTLRAVDDVGFEVARGETFALLGESGCGKSMTALSLMRLVPPPGRVVSGRVFLDGQDLMALPEVAMRRVRGGRMAMIFQEPQTSLNPVLTVGDQIDEALRVHHALGRRAARDRSVDLLMAVGIPEPAERYGAYPHQLSGGMKQRVMIAMALAGEPDLLIADEPTTALDVTIQAQILELLGRLQRERHLSLLLITHDLGVVAQVAQRVGVMYAGHIVELARREEFFREPLHPYSRKLFDALPTSGKRAGRLAVIPGSVPMLTREFVGCRFAERCQEAWQLCRDRAPRWLQAGPNRWVRCHLYDQSVASTREAEAAARPRTPAPGRGGDDAVEVQKTQLLEVEDLKVHFPVHKGLFKRVVGHVRAVDGVSMTLPSGQTLALVGESGCGKTTAGKGLLQLIRPTAGSVRFKGDELTRLKGEALRRRRREFQIIFQDPYSSMNPRMTVQDIVEEGMIVQGIGGSRAARRAAVDRLLDRVGLGEGIKGRYPHEFSGGQRQRICIARALAVEPSLIVCDEPTSALDVSVQAQILNLLSELQGRLGISYLFITHNISVVEYLAHEVAVMYLGRIVEQGSVDEVLGAPKHPYTQALLSAVPVIENASRRAVIRLGGDPPSPVHPPAGCHFQPRCPHAMPVCRERYPAATQLSATHSTRCHLYGTRAS